MGSQFGVKQGQRLMDSNGKRIDIYLADALVDSNGIHRCPHCGSPDQNWIEIVTFVQFGFPGGIEKQTSHQVCESCGKDFGVYLEVKS